MDGACEGEQSGFTLMEMMAVVVLIMIMLAVVGLTFANSRESVKVRRDANQCLAFLRNMWDLAKTSSAPVALLPDYRNGKLRYLDPRSGSKETLRFDSEAHVLAIVLNDRVFTQTQMQEAKDQSDPEDILAGAIYIAEGRGLTRLGILLGVPVKSEETEQLTEKVQWPSFASLNLITGKGKIVDLDDEKVQEIMQLQEEQQIEAEMEQTP